MLVGLLLKLATLVADKSPKMDIRFLALQNEGFFGGDMILPYNYILKNGILDEAYRWPGYPGGARIPYVIDPSLANHRYLILSAMEHYHENTCVRFVERTVEPDYVQIFKGPGCYSVVGRNGSEEQPQPLSLGNGCLNIGTIIHELGHTIGFYHEQNRSDRDDYLIVHSENISPNHWHNFIKLRSEQNLLLTPFDNDSIMIYGNYAFSKNPPEDITLEAKNGQPLRNPYEKIKMTKSDIERVKKMYKCA